MPPHRTKNKSLVETFAGILKKRIHRLGLSWLKAWDNSISEERPGHVTGRRPHSIQPTEAPE
ncbi:hypothetical protein CHELA40_10063 [Chelatococcus asaccharovorans]|nr:hypothetical protein CHELA40_10063 [Chelatococcus asaccharovorans]CAH1687622.1 hypothetical protein CHELA17_65543 [Chelatococcus asaccharovorans]